MTKKTWKPIIILVLSCLVSACSSNTKDSVTKEVKTTKASAPKTEQKDDTQEAQESIVSEGKYVGQIDNNSIEVETNGEIVVLRLTDSVRESIASLEDGSEVSFTYKKDVNDQNILEKITAINPESAKQPGTKTLQYTVNGNQVKKEAVLTNSEQNYSFYKVDDFEFTAEEPGKDLMFATEYGDTLVRIEPLSEGASIDDIKKWAHDELEAIGEVKEVKGSEVAGPSFENTELFITAEKDSFKKYIVIQKHENGKMMKYTINLSDSKKSAELEQEIWAMLATVEAK